MGGLADLVIGISGNIGAGKTTLIEAAQSDKFKHILLDTLSINPAATKKITSLREDVDFTLLPSFYQNPKRYAFTAQINFFNARLKRERLVQNTPGIVLVDRPIEEDYHIFGKAQRILGHMDEQEFQIYAQTYQEMANHIYPPDVYIYLKSDLATLQRNITHRGRNEEQLLTTTTHYLETLNGLYDHFFQKHVSVPIIEIDTSKMHPSDTLDETYLKDTLTHIATQLTKHLNIPKLTPHLGKWLSYNPTQAVLEQIQVEEELKTYLANHTILISVAGNIGLGKTATTRILSHELNIPGIYELDAQKDTITDDLLAQFLGNKPKYCFELQRHLLQKRLSLRAQSAAKNISCVEDRTPEEDPAIFHRFFHQLGYLTNIQLDQLETESMHAYQTARPSQLLIVLQGKPELARERIIQRGRPEEVDAWKLESELKPLAKLYSQFPSLVKNYGLHQGPILIFDVDRIDITNRAHQGFMYEQILQALK